MKEALFYEKTNSSIKCNLCARKCSIPENGNGFCRVRKNIKGKLYSMNYGKLCSIATDPIEKKPLYMFAPGTKTLSISSVGCNFKCQFCCNWQISQESEITGEEHTPETVFQIAQKQKVQGISYTYTEPTVFYEFAHGTAKLSNKKFYNMFVTNGYTAPEAIKQISKYLDAAAVDIKASLNPDFYRKFSEVSDVQPIYDALLAYKQNNVHIEITNLIVPEIGDGMGDLKKVSRWIVENLGDNVPFHILQFFPTYKITNLPRTPIETLERAYNTAKEQGLKYVYIGNVHKHELENTYCQNCRNLLIERTITGVKDFKLKRDLKCPNCEHELALSGTRWISDELWKE